MGQYFQGFITACCSSSPVQLLSALDINVVHIAQVGQHNHGIRIACLYGLFIQLDGVLGVDYVQKPGEFCDGRQVPGFDRTLQQVIGPTGAIPVPSCFSEFDQVCGT